LLVPKKRKFDPFGESLRGKLRRLLTRGDGLNSRQKDLGPTVAALSGGDCVGHAGSRAPVAPAGLPQILALALKLAPRWAAGSESGLPFMVRIAGGIILSA